jgi:predicted  nucleic acid-binding Zn-ribbon protein
MKIQRLAIAVLLLGLGACSSLYYGTWEKLGVPKRKIMVDRVKEARDTQNETKQRFLSAMEQFKSVVEVKGGDLEKQYEKLRGTLKKSESGADAVRKRIRSVESVSEALFKEWRKEIDLYSGETLRAASQKNYDLTKGKYEALIAAMKKAESKLEPALVPLRDQVLFMKHNLNARAVSGLSEELARVETNVDQLVQEMESAVAEADKFIASLQAE